MKAFYTLTCGSLAGFDWIESRGIGMSVSNLPHSSGNRVWRTSLTPAEAGTRIKEVIDFYSSRGLPFLWMVGPRDSPPDLSKRLEEAGLVRGEGTRMAMDLRQLKQPAEPSGFESKKVEDLQTLETFSRLAPEAYGVAVSLQEAASSWLRRMGLNQNLYQYLGCLGGKPVATSLVLLCSGVAGLYYVATLPEARGKGIGSAITAAPLIEAREEGYRIAILQSTKLGYPVYARLGFKETRKGVSYSLKR